MWIPRTPRTRSHKEWVVSFVPRSGAVDGKCDRSTFLSLLPPFVLRHPVVLWLLVLHWED